MFEAVPNRNFAVNRPFIQSKLLFICGSQSHGSVSEKVLGACLVAWNGWIQDSTLRFESVRGFQSTSANGLNSWRLTAQFLKLVLGDSINERYVMRFHLWETRASRESRNMSRSSRRPFRRKSSCNQSPAHLVTTIQSHSNDQASTKTVLGSLSSLAPSQSGTCSQNQQSTLKTRQHLRNKSPSKSNYTAKPTQATN